VVEEVEKVDPDLVARDRQGQPYSVRYDEVNAMLLNEFLKEHHKVEQQGRTIQEQGKNIEELIAQLKAQGTLIQSVNDKIEMSKGAQVAAKQ
jgi:hypothetical protein